MWPELPKAWRRTYVTLHMWTQIVGKIALARAPPLNHSWGAALQLTARGLSTRPLPHGSRTFTVELDFIEHRLVIAVSDRSQRVIPLSARSVAQLYREIMAALHELNLPVHIWTMPVEVPSPVRFEHDTAHASYDREQVDRFWQILLACERVFSEARCEFIGKASPVHFFWGSFDLAVSRFSGRPAPPRDGPAFMQESYSHEVISHGFWPGGGEGTAFGPGAVEEPVFYAYCVPPPPGFETMAVEPAAAFYQKDFAEFMLPYAAVRGASDPDGALRAFVESTYSRAADLAHWDRRALERPASSVAERR